MATSPSGRFGRRYRAATTSNTSSAWSPSSRRARKHTRARGKAWNRTRQFEGAAGLVGVRVRAWKELLNAGAAVTGPTATDYGRSRASERAACACVRAGELRLLVDGVRLRRQPRDARCRRGAGYVPRKYLGIVRPNLSIAGSDLNACRV
eukprot:6177562-Pleurochrysis_carterae.AAC.4